MAENIIRKMFVAGIDTDNILASDITSSYTATQNCMVVIETNNTSASNLGKAYINDVLIIYNYESAGTPHALRDSFILLKGQTLSLDNFKASIYGLKFSN